MDRFYRLCAAVPAAAPGDVSGNLKSLKKAYLDATSEGAAVVVFPGFAISGDACGSLAQREDFLGECRAAAEDFAASTGRAVAVFGTLWDFGGKGASAVVVAQNGRIAAVIPDRFEAAASRLRFEAGFSFSVAAGSIDGAEVEADALFVSGAEPFFAGVSAGRARLFSGDSALRKRAVVFANAGSGLSGTDRVGDGDALIASCGNILARGSFFASGSLVFSDVDFGRIAYLRKRSVPDTAETVRLENLPESPDFRYARISRDPFFDEAREDLPRITEGAAVALAQRMKHTGAKCLVLGVSGGLDSTFALLVCSGACDRAGIPHDRVHALTLPGFGTSDRTFSNAQKLAAELGATLKTIDISDACAAHLNAIGHDGKTPDAAYENAQARERTQILMDYANLHGGIVVGTGDLSELALGWCTYNGDQMSMYAVNASLPKTLIRRLLEAEARTRGGALAEIFRDVIATPVSPELLPSPEGKAEIVQHTESILGPYELHDFFLYHYMTGGAGKEKLFRLACAAFDGVFDPKIIRRTLDRFFGRLFSQQFKRDAMPDGVQLTGVSLSPRCGWSVPGDIVR